MIMNTNSKHTIYPAIIFLVTIALYCNALSGDFIWDDRGLIVDHATYLGDWKNLYEGFCKPFFGDTPYYRPLLMGSFIVDYQLWGTEPFGYHFTNLVLHSVNALLVYVLVFILVQQAGIALWTSLLFTAHPVQSEAVAWISGRNDLLLTFFALISIVLHLRWRHFQEWIRPCAYIAFLISYLAALFTKESALVLPLLFMLANYFYQDKNRNPAWDFAGMLLISVLYYSIRIIVIGSAGMGWHGGDWPGSLAGVIATYAYYFKMLVFPVFQSAVPDLTQDSLEGLSLMWAYLMAITPIVIAVIYRKRLKEVSFAVFWVLISLIPVCGIFTLSVPALEHRLYLGTVCFCLLLPVVLYRAPYHQILTHKTYNVRTLVSLLLPVVLVLYAAKTMERNEVWEQELPFWTRTVQDSPGSSVAHNNLGVVYARAGNNHMAIRAFRKALALQESADTVANRQNNVQRGKIFNNLGQSYYQLLRKRMTDAESFSPAGAAGDNHRADIDNETGRLFAASRSFYQNALKINPSIAEIHNNLGDLFYLMNHYEDAEEEYGKALRISPNRAEYYNNLGLAQYGLRNFKEAEEKLLRAIAIQPGYFEARNNLALVYMHLGLYTRALDELKIALTSSLDNSGVCFNLSLVYLRGFGDSERAMYYLKEGLRLRSRDSHDALFKNGFKDL
jgi:tetratricopeptide (TPR) repeat protein